MEATFSFDKFDKIVTDNMPSRVFLTRAEFLKLSAKMFDYRDANVDELREVCGGGHT